MSNNALVIRIKRVYEVPAPADGLRVLVDRLWPRGLSKEKAKIDLWVKDLAPSTELRQWYRHDVAKWAEFKAKYTAELRRRPGQVIAFLTTIGANVTTLLYSAKEPQFNNAVALLAYLKRCDALAST